MEVADTSEIKQPPHSEIDQLTRDYSKYLQVNASKERQAFYDSIEEMLTKLDEFGGLVDMIRSDTNLCLNENVPRLQGRCEEMRQLFARIDQLEAFVGIVRQNVGSMEEHLEKAEHDLGSFSVKNFFSSLLGSKKPHQSKEQLTFDPPEIFVTEEYLAPNLPVQRVSQEPAITVETQQVPAGHDGKAAGDDQSEDRQQDGT